MKPLITALAICVFLLAGSAAVADPDTHTWSGAGANENWSTSGNWDAGVPATNDHITLTDPSESSTSIFDASASDSPYGDLIIGNNSTAMTLRVNKEAIAFDTCSFVGNTVIDGNYNMSCGTTSLDQTTATVSVDTGRTVSVSTLSLDAATADASRALTKALTGTLTVTTSTTLTGDDAGNYPATFTLSAGTFDPAALYLYGGDTSARQAVFHLDAGTLTKPDSTTCERHVELQVDAGESANFGNTLCDADATLEVIDNTTGTCQTDEFRVEDAGDNANITVTKTGAGTLSCSSLVVKGADATYTATFTISAGGVVSR